MIKNGTFQGKRGQKWEFPSQNCKKNGTTWAFWRQRMAKNSQKWNFSGQKGQKMALFKAKKMQKMVKSVGFFENAICVHFLSLFFAHV